MGVALESIGKPLRIALMDAVGREVASVAGLLIGPEGVIQEGERFAEFVVSKDGMAATIRLPVRADSHCTIGPDGVITGRLPSGAAWSISSAWAA